MRRKRILVTGGAGFIGSHLCARLLGDGQEVLCVDNYLTGTKSNIVSLLDHPYFEMMRHDVTFPLYVEVDEIYNLACPESLVHYQFDSMQTTKTCVHGAINMLGLAKRLKAKILQASTREVYGDPTQHPQSEDYLGNVNSIVAARLLRRRQALRRNAILRLSPAARPARQGAAIFNTYRPRMLPNDGRVVSKFGLWALRGEPITLYGDGGQTRSFCYVDDLVDGLIRLMASDGAVTGPINLGNPEETSVRALAERIITATGSSSRLEFAALPVDGPRRRCPDIKRAKALLGWQPSVSLDQGLARTICYFRTVGVDS